MESTSHPTVDRAFEQIEQTILPSVALMLDSLLEAAAAARPGIDAATYSAELRTMALHVEELTRQVEALAPLASRPVQEPLRLRMSA